LIAALPHATPPIGKINTFSKIAINFELLKDAIYLATSHNWPFHF
jgi:hypothetical protein